MVSKMGVVGYAIRDLVPNMVEDIFVVGVIMRSQQSRTIVLKKDNSERGVWSFTLRDSINDMINVTVWGKPEYVTDLHSRFQVGDVVDLEKVKPKFRKLGDNEDLYQPAVQSTFHLVFNEGVSQMYLHDPEDSDYYTRLLHVPTKPFTNFLTISDVRSNTDRLRGLYVNLLCAVEEIGERKQIRKGALNSWLREVVLMDDTHPEFLLTIWGEDMMEIVEKWRPRSTVLFLADVKIDYNNFKKVTNAMVTSRTIITSDPDTADGRRLKAYALAAPPHITTLLDRVAANIPATAMSCNATLTKAHDPNQMEEFLALVTCFPITFNVDGSANVVVPKCMNCGMKLYSSVICQNASCDGDFMEQQTELCYDIRATLADHTGTLTNCRISESVAQKLLQQPASSFASQPNSARSQLKWNHLFKPCTIRLSVIPKMRRNAAPSFSILSWDHVTPSQYSLKAQIF